MLGNERDEPRWRRLPSVGRAPSSGEKAGEKELVEGEVGQDVLQRRPDRAVASGMVERLDLMERELDGDRDGVPLGSVPADQRGAKPAQEADLGGPPPIGAARRGPRPGRACCCLSSDVLEGRWRLWGQRTPGVGREAVGVDRERAPVCATAHDDQGMIGAVFAMAKGVADDVTGEIPASEGAFRWDSLK